MNEGNGIEVLNKFETLIRENVAPIQIAGRTYSLEDLKRIDEPTWKPPVREFLTLTGLVTYAISNPDSIPKDVFLHINDFNVVSLVGPPVGERKEVTVYATAKSPTKQEFPFDQFHPAEEMVIKLRTLFQNTVDLDSIIQMMMKIDVESGVTLIEDGISQGLVVKQGVSGVNKERVINKGYQELAPIRTFQEIVQPTSTFLFRLKATEDKGVFAAVFSAGGQAWRLDAIQKIKVWLEENTAHNIVVLG